MGQHRSPNSLSLSGLPGKNRHRPNGKTTRKTQPNQAISRVSANLWDGGDIFVQSMTQDPLANVAMVEEPLKSIRSGPMKIESGNLVWRSQGALDAVTVSTVAATDVRTIASEQNFSGKSPGGPGDPRS